MTTRNWRWLGTAGVVVAAGLAGWSQAQEAPRLPAQLPPKISEPAVETNSAAPCRPSLAHSIWNRMKSRLEKCLVSEEPDLMPLGQSIHLNFSAQVNNGIAARMMLYDFDFEDGKANLSPRGQDQLSQVLAWAQRYPYAVVIERNRYQPKLADERRLAVLKELSSRGVPLAADRIVVGMPVVPGNAGVEAWIQYGNLLNQTQSQGMSRGGQDAGGTGTTGATSGNGMGTSGTTDR